MTWLWKLLLPEWAHTVLLAVGFLAAGLALAMPGTWVAMVCEIIAWLAGAGGVAGKIRNEWKIVTEGIELGPVPVRPPGHVEGDPLPAEFPPGTEAGPDHSPYDPTRP